MLEDLQPGIEVSGMIRANLRRQIQIGGKERRAKLRHEFLGGLIYIARALSAKVAGQVLLVPLRL
jgi:hypothetical protein